MPSDFLISVCFFVLVDPELELELELEFLLSVLFVTKIVLFSQLSLFTLKCLLMRMDLPLIVEENLKKLSPLSNQTFCFDAYPGHLRTVLVFMSQIVLAEAVDNGKKTSADIIYFILLAFSMGRMNLIL